MTITLRIQEMTAELAQPILIGERVATSTPGIAFVMLQRMDSVIRSGERRTNNAVRRRCLQESFGFKRFNNSK